MECLHWWLPLNRCEVWNWIEPEMISPKSELFEKHSEWAIHLPNRETYYYRNQLVLDLSNPKVQDFVFGVVDNIMTENPDVAFFKWDCNSPITNVYSPYLENKVSFISTMCVAFIMSWKE